MNITEDVVFKATQEYLDCSYARSPQYNPVSAMRNALTVAVNMMSEWQPIETAPKDKTILIFHHDYNKWRGQIRIGYSHGDYNGHKDVITEDGQCGWPIRPLPTHWMPLPTPPKDK